MKLKITRSMTINTGNYQNIGPNVSMEWEIPDSKATSLKINNEYDKKTDILEKLFSLEVMSLYMEQKEINRDTKGYCESVIKTLNNEE